MLGDALFPQGCFSAFLPMCQIQVPSIGSWVFLEAPWEGGF